jgi:GntR family transcriptional regulator
VIKIDTASFIPIYEQIKRQIKSRILLGDLRNNEPLPSIRDLATSLIINPNTVARAYRELEIEGFIYTRKGKGCYVSGDSSSLIEKELTKIMNQIFDEAIEEARKFKLDPKQIKRHFEQRLDLNMEGDEKGEKNG